MLEREKKKNDLPAWSFHSKGEKLTLKIIVIYMLCWKVVYTMEDIYLNKRNEGCWGKVPKQAKKGLLRDDIGPKV